MKKRRMLTCTAALLLLVTGLSSCYVGYRERGPRPRHHHHHHRHHGTTVIVR